MVLVLVTLVDQKRHVQHACEVVHEAHVDLEQHQQLTALVLLLLTPPDCSEFLKVMLPDVTCGDEVAKHAVSSTGPLPPPAELPAPQCPLLQPRATSLVTTVVAAAMVHSIRGQSQVGGVQRRP